MFKNYQKCHIWNEISCLKFAGNLAPSNTFTMKMNILSSETFMSDVSTLWMRNIRWYHILHRNVDDGVGDGKRWKNGCVVSKQYRSSSTSIKLTSLLHLSLVISIPNGWRKKKRRLPDFSFLLVTSVHSRVISKMEMAWIGLPTLLVVPMGTLRYHTKNGPHSMHPGPAIGGPICTSMAM